MLVDMTDWTGTNFLYCLAIVVQASQKAAGSCHGVEVLSMVSAQQVHDLMPCCNSFVRFKTGA